MYYIQYYNYCQYFYNFLLIYYIIMYNLHLFDIMLYKFINIKETILKEQIKKILDISDKTYYNWKNQSRPIISLLEKYFTEEDIQEFLDTGKIFKFENITSEFLFSNQLLYVESFAKSKSLLSEPHVKDKFKNFYFSFLLNFENIDIPFSIDTLGIKSLLTNYLYRYQMDKIKENIKIVKINEKFENLKLDIDDAINSTIGIEKKN